MGKSLQTAIWFASVALLGAAAAWTIWLYFDTTFQPRRTWIDGPETEDLIRLGLLVVGCLGLGVSCRPFSKRRAYVVAGVAAVATIGFYFLGNGLAVTASEQAGSMTWMPERKPNANKTVMGYHWRVPELGGQVAFGDGSVGHLTAAEFAAAPRAEPPDVEPRFRSPRKTAPLEEGTPEKPARERDPNTMIREAEERMKAGSFLKRLAVAHFALLPSLGGRPPLDPEELAGGARLNNSEKAELMDGTYVWHFGWNPYISPKHTWDDIKRTEKLSWLVFSAFGAGLGGLLFGILMLVRAKKPDAPGATPVR